MFCTNNKHLIVLRRNRKDLMLWMEKTRQQGYTNTIGNANKDLKKNGVDIQIDVLAIAKKDQDVKVFFIEVKKLN